MWKKAEEERSKRSQVSKRFMSGEVFFFRWNEGE